MTKDDLQIARWRCAHVHRIPAEVLDDFLHDAIVLALERPDGEIQPAGMANWLALVAYRRFLTDKYRLRTRKTKQWPQFVSKDEGVIDVDFKSPCPCPQQIAEEEESAEELTSKVMNLIEGLHPRHQTSLHLRARTNGWHQVANSEGLTRQAIALRLKKVREQVKEDP